MMMMHLASSDNSDVQEAALGGLLELAQDRTSGGTTALAEEDKLKEVLQECIESISSMPTEDLGADKEERRLVNSLWNTCCKEPLSLRDKGLLVLPREDAFEPPPDVASKVFEPPLRAWAADRPQSSPVEDKKKEASPLLLGPGPVNRSSNEAH